MFKVYSAYRRCQFWTQILLKISVAYTDIIKFLFCENILPAISVVLFVTMTLRNKSLLPVVSGFKFTSPWQIVFKINSDIYASWNKTLKSKICRKILIISGYWQYKQIPNPFAFLSVLWTLGWAMLRNNSEHIKRCMARYI